MPETEKRRVSVHSLCLLGCLFMSSPTIPFVTPDPRVPRPRTPESGVLSVSSERTRGSGFHYPKTVRWKGQSEGEISRLGKVTTGHDVC